MLSMKSVTIQSHNLIRSNTKIMQVYWPVSPRCTFLPLKESESFVFLISRSASRIDLFYI